jgi:hypothetical protein
VVDPDRLHQTYPFESYRERLSPAAWSAITESWARRTLRGIFLQKSGYNLIKHLED